MVVRTDSRRAGDQAAQTCRRGEGVKWIKVKPSKTELPSQANLPNWAKVVLDCSFTDWSHVSLSLLFMSEKWICVFISWLFREWMCVFITCVSMFREWMCVFMKCVSREWVNDFNYISLENECGYSLHVSLVSACVYASHVYPENKCVYMTCGSREGMRVWRMNVGIYYMCLWRTNRVFITCVSTEWTCVPFTCI